MITVAADDPRIAAVVAQVAVNGFPKKVQSLSHTLRLLGAMIRDEIRGRLGRSPYYIPAVGSTTDLAVMTSPQAKQAIEGMNSNQWHNKVAPRALFEMMRYKPSDKAHQLAMPVPVCIAEYDREVPPELTRQIAENAPSGEVRSYPITHFDIYRSEVRAQVVKDQIEFLQEHLRSKAD